MKAHIRTLNDIIIKDKGEGIELMIGVEYTNKEIQNLIDALQEMLDHKKDNEN